MRQHTAMLMAVAIAVGVGVGSVLAVSTDSSYFVGVGAAVGAIVGLVFSETRKQPR